MCIKNKTGFTLVEISLATAFLSALLLTIALLLNSLPKMYQKGVTISAINYTGQEIIDEVTAALSSASDTDLESKCDQLEGGSRSACQADRGIKFLIQSFNTNVQIRRNSNSNPGIDYTNIEVPLGGILCTGYYTFIWNSGYVLDKSGEYYVKPDGTKISESDYSKYRIGYKKTSSSPTNYDFRLIRVLDTRREVCTNRIIDDTKSYANVNSYDASVVGSTNPIIIPENPTASVTEDKVLELLSSSEADGDLALYDLNMFYPTRSSSNGHAFYSGTFILATISGAVDVTSSGNYCSPPGDEKVAGEFIYCAINKFNFAVRATGGIKL